MTDKKKQKVLQSVTLRGNSETQARIEIRRGRVFLFVLAGFPITQIAQELKTSRMTIWRDVKANKEKTSKYLDEIQQDNRKWIEDVRDNLRGANEEAWKMYLSKENPNIKLGALKLILEDQHRQNDILIKAGVLEATPERFEHKVETYITEEDLDEALKRLKKRDEDERGGAAGSVSVGGSGNG